MVKKTSKHDTLVSKVEDELRHRGYTDINKFVEYSNNCICGELDIYAVKDNYVLLFEIKCTKTSKSYKKANNQLYRAENSFFKRGQRIFKFMVYGDNNYDPVYEWITQQR